MKERIKAIITVLRESKHPVRFLFGQLLVKSGLNRFFTIRMDKYKINLSRSAIAVTLFANPKERHEDEEFLQRILRPGDVYADIGANIGTLVLTASSIVGPEGKVVGIEAHPVTFKYLAANVKLNKFSNVVLINSAAGERQGTIFFSSTNSDDQNKVLLQHSKGIEVKVNTVDELLNTETNIDLLKIDVEGYEKFVLEGAIETLKKTSIVYFESWEKHFAGFGYNTSTLVSMLRHSGFEVYKPGAGTLEPLPAVYKSLICENLVAIKDTRQFCTDYGYHIKPFQ